MVPSSSESEDLVRVLAALLPISDIANSIHGVLWTLSRQLGLRIFVSDGSEGKQVEVVKMSEVGTHPEK